MSPDEQPVRRALLSLALIGTAPLSALVLTAGPASAASCGSVGQGSVGERVAAVQTAVGTTSDGDFGSGTLSAVQAAERSRGLAVTTSVDQPTFVKLGGQGDFCAMDTWSSPVRATPSDSAQARVDAIIAFAKEQVGKGYLWGGTGEGRYDCSGLTMQALHSIGVNLGRVATSQYQASATHVPVDQARPGDLLVYGTNGSAGSIYHIAVFVGGGQMVEAQNPRNGVVMDAVRTYDLLPQAIRAVDGDVWQPSGLTAPLGSPPAPTPPPPPVVWGPPVGDTSPVVGHGPTTGRSRGAAHVDASASGDQVTDAAARPVTVQPAAAQPRVATAAPAAEPDAEPAQQAHAATVRLSRLLAQGASGAGVAAVQQVVGVEADGVFGPLTLAAVQAFQQAHALVPDGVVGPLTAAALGLG